MQIAQFVFDIFDTKGAKAISPNDVTELIMFVYGSETVDARVKKIISSMEINKMGLVNITEFVSAAHKYPALLFPAYDLQVFVCTINRIGYVSIKK